MALADDTLDGGRLREVEELPELVVPAYGVLVVLVLVVRVAAAGVAAE